MNVGDSKPAFTATEDLRNVTAACRQRWSRRNWWRKREPASKPDKKLSQKFKFLLPKPELQWPPPVLPFSAPALLEDHGVLLDPEKTLEETQRFLERTVSGGKNWPVFIKTEQDLASLSQTALPMSRPKAERCGTPHLDPPNTGRNNLTGLMEKNNVSVPLDCTTRVVGFKMVDGRKHIVLRVIPSSQQNVSAPKKSKSVESGCCSQTPADQRIEPNQSNDVSTSNAPRNVLYSVSERRKGWQGHQRQTHTGGKTHISSSGSEMNRKAAQSHRSTTEFTQNTSAFTREENFIKQEFLSAQRIKDCQEKSLRDSQENFTTSQGDFGCHGDQAPRSSLDPGFLEERCHVLFITQRKQQNAALSSVNKGTANTETANPDSCPESSSGCNSSASASPMKDLTESLHHLGGEVGDVLFHSTGAEGTNNTDPRDSPLPVDESDCEMLAAELYQTVDDRLLHREATGLTFSSDHSDETHTEEPVEHSRTELSVPLASLNQPALSWKRVVEVLVKDSKSQKPSGPEESDIIAPVLHWEPVPPDVPRTLRLSPYCPSQPIKALRAKQPIVVLNHPDTEIPEVTNIMRVIHKHRGAVQRVVLSRKTLQALSQFHCDVYQSNCTADCRASHCRRAWPSATATERFSLKLRLKRVCGRNYTVVPSVLESAAVQPTFRCWFCGRLFQNQEVWVGHGQRHLMEATRGWKQLFHRDQQNRL